MKIPEISTLSSTEEFSKEKHKKISGIYVIYNTVNRKYYIGSSKKIAVRLYQHIRDLTKNAHINTRLQNAWNKYTKDSFKFYIIEQLIDQDLKNREQLYIDVFDASNRKFGYNISSSALFGKASPRKKVLISAKRRLSAEDLSGRTSNHWTILKRDLSKKRVSWICRCVCGVEKSIDAGTLKKKRHRSCGCKRLIDLSNKIFGQWQVLYPSFSTNLHTRNVETYWMCLCSCGKYKEVVGSNLRKGISKSCGCSKKK